MNNIEQLENIWQSHQPDLDFKVDSNKISNSVLDKIKRTERKIFRVNLAKTIIVSILILNFVWIFFQLKISTVFSWLGVGCISISTLAFLIFYWRIQFRSSNLNHSLSQNEFILDTIFQMKVHKKRFVRLFSGFVLLVTIGINLFYTDLLVDLDLGSRLIYHLIITILFSIIFFFGLKFRERKFKKEFQPLIDELESIKE